MNNLIHQPEFGNELPAPDALDYLLELQNDTRSREQRAAEREARREAVRERAGLRPRAVVEPMTDEEHRDFCKRIADREALLVMQVNAYIDWLVTTPGPLTLEQVQWLDYAAAESLISNKRLAAFERWERKHKVRWFWDETRGWFAKAAPAKKTSATDDWIESVMRRAG